MWELQEGSPPRRRKGKTDDAVEWVKERLGFPADSMQAQVLRTKTKRGLLNYSRQWGKSTITAAKAVHQAQRTAGCLPLVLGPSARQSGEFLRKATEFARRLGIRPKGDGDNQISLELPNRSRIVGLPGTEATIRGLGLGLSFVEWIVKAHHGKIDVRSSVGHGSRFVVTLPRSATRPSEHL